MTATAPKPVLLLIPGMLNTGRVWNRVVRLLDEHAEIRIADVTRQASISAMAHDAWQLVADVPSTQHLAICGFSMGGYVALEMIASNSIAFNGYSTRTFGLIHTSSRAETVEGKLVREKTIAAIKRDFERVIKGIAGFGTHTSHHADADLMAETLSIMRDAGAEVAVRQLRAIMARADYGPLLAQIKARTLVVSSKDDAVVPPAASEEMADHIAGARLAWIEPAGHMSPLEQPLQLANLLKTLL